jgi:hypothetical protein
MGYLRLRYSMHIGDCDGVVAVECNIQKELVARFQGLQRKCSCRIYAAPSGSLFTFPCKYPLLVSRLSLRTTYTHRIHDAIYDLSRLSALLYTL